MEFQPVWLTFEVQEALSRLPTRRHRDTVLRLAEGRLVGRSEQETFRLPEVCSRRTWYGRYRGGVKHPGWKEDVLVQGALAAATARAQWWEDNTIARNIQQAQEQLAGASPDAVGVLIGLMTAADGEETRRKAANDILDRASVDTAPKGKEALTIAMTWGDEREADGGDAAAA